MHHLLNRGETTNHQRTNIELSLTHKGEVRQLILHLVGPCNAIAKVTRVKGAELGQMVRGDPPRRAGKLEWRHLWETLTLHISMIIQYSPFPQTS